MMSPRDPGAESDQSDDDLLNPWAALTREQQAAWTNILMEEGMPLALAKVLRPVAELLETRRWPQSRFSVVVRGLLRLCSDAFALVEAGQVPPYSAAAVGNGEASLAPYVGPTTAAGPSVATARADHQMRLLVELAQKVRGHSKRLWDEADWSVFSALSWIEFGEKTRLCDVYGDEALKVRWSEPNSSQFLLISALKDNKLRAVRNGEELPDCHWFNKRKLEAATRYRRRDMLHLWPVGHRKQKLRVACLRWLMDLRRFGPPTRNRKEYAAEAFDKFGVTDGQFRSIWTEATKKVPNDQWGKPGLKSSKTIEH